MDRLRQNFAAATLELGSAHVDRIAALDRNRHYVTAEFWEKPGNTYTVKDVRDE